LHKVFLFQHNKARHKNPFGGEKVDTKDFLKRALLNEQEQVRDYQRFADSTEDEAVAQIFRDFAETEALQARKIKELLEGYGGDS
jgi:rubrerythrin